MWRTRFSNADPRIFQIFTLGSLLVLHVLTGDFAPEIEVVSLTVLTCVCVQILCLQFFRVPQMSAVPDLKSPVITALSLSILLKAGSLWVHPVAAAVAISSKFLFRVDNKHIFNPANIGIVTALLLFPHWSWISPAQWGHSLLLGFALLCLAMLVLYKIPRRDMGPMFFVVWAGFLFGRALWLGDPLDIPLLNLKNGAILIFAFFMISDPKTIPDTLKGRFIFALSVCTLAYIMLFVFQIRAGLFYALALACLFRPVLDRIWQGRAYQWSMSNQQG